MDQSNTKVVYWNNQPTPYMVGRFNALVRRGNLTFEAWFNLHREPDRSWALEPGEWHFGARFIPLRNFYGYSLYLPTAELHELRPDLLVSMLGVGWTRETSSGSTRFSVSGSGTASFALGTIAAKQAGVRVAYRILPTFQSWIPPNRLKNIVKANLARLADAAKVPGPDGAQVAARLSIPPERTFQVTQSIDFAHFNRAVSLRSSVSGQLRRELGIAGCAFLYSGRLWRGKGLDELFAAYQQVRQVNRDVTLVLVGDGVDERRYRNLAQDIPGVIFCGFRQPADLPTYYALGDVFVFPTHGDPHGLVIEEAMAAGLPVITTSAAGDVLRRVPYGEVGFTVPPNNVEDLADRMLTLAGDPQLRSRLAKAAVDMATHKDHERWAEDFELFVEGTMNLPPRQTLASGVLAPIVRLAMGVTGADLPATLINPEKVERPREDRVVCPACLSALEKSQTHLTCTNCRTMFPIVEGIPHLVRSSPTGNTEDDPQIDFFDSALDHDYEVTRPHGLPRLHRWFLLEKFRQGTRGIRQFLYQREALVVCGGSGMDAEFLTRAGALVTTADLSPGTASRAHKRSAKYGLNIVSLVSDVTQLPFPDASIPFVYVHDGLHHLRNPLEGLKEMARVASYAISINEPARSLATRLAVLLGISEDVEEAGNRVARLNLKETQEFLRTHGFQILHARRYGMFYRHEPGIAVRFFSHKLLFPIAILSWRIFNFFFGSYGNKLSVIAVKSVEVESKHP